MASNDDRRMVRAVMIFSGVLGLTGYSAACISEGSDDGNSGATPDAATDATNASDTRDESALDAAGREAEASAPLDASNEPVVCGATPCAIALAAGGRHMCALMSDGTVSCWGDNQTGQAGPGGPGAIGDDGGPPWDPGPSPFTAHPATVGLQGAVQIVASSGQTYSRAYAGVGDATCALLSDGSVECWGDDKFGQLGQVDNGAPLVDGTRHPVPAPVAGLPPARQIALGARNGCAVMEAGDVYCWGDAQNGLVGPPSAVTPIASATNVFTLTTPHELALAIHAGLAIGGDGLVMSWGSAPLNGRIVSETDPEPGVALALAASSIASSELDVLGVGTVGHACAAASGQVYCWGVNVAGCLGLGFDDPNTYTLQTSPLLREQPTRVRLPDGAMAQQVSVSTGYPPLTYFSPRAADLKESYYASSCARTTDGAVYCWGNNDWGELGTGEVGEGSYGAASVPVKVTGLGGAVVQVATMVGTTCALLKDGRVQCWGLNDAGQLGRGDSDYLPHPAPASVVF